MLQTVSGRSTFCRIVNLLEFLADRSITVAYAVVLRPSVICNLCKPILAKKLSEEAITEWPMVT